MRPEDVPTYAVAGQYGPAKVGGQDVPGFRQEPSVSPDAQTDTYENLVQAGVIDPTKVTRTALQNAASIAGLLLTTEALVVEKKEEKSAMPAPGGGGMGGMY